MTSKERLRERFVNDVKEFAAAYFSPSDKSWTTYEHEAATLCLLLDTMGTDPHRDRILDCVSTYLMRRRNGQHGPIGQLLADLATLHAERLGAA